MNRNHVIVSLMAALSLCSCMDRDPEFAAMSAPAKNSVGRILVFEGDGLFSLGEDEDDLVLYLGQPRPEVETILGASLGQSYGYETYRRGGIAYQISFGNDNLASQIELFGNRFLVNSGTQSGLIMGGYGDTRAALEARYGRPATPEYEHWTWPENGIVWYPDVATGRVRGVGLRYPTLTSGITVKRILDQDQDGFPSYDSIQVRVRSATGNRGLVVWMDYRPAADTSRWLPLNGPDTLLAGSATTYWPFPVYAGCGTFHDRIGLRLRLADVADTTRILQTLVVRDTIPLESYPSDGVKLAACAP
jgi:hypothetical protein